MDFIVDAAGDAYSDWVNACASLLYKPDTDDAVKTYRDTHWKFYSTLEWYYGQKSSPSSPYLTGGALHTPLSLSLAPNATVCVHVCIEELLLKVCASDV